MHISLNFPFSVFGGDHRGFQRYDANNMVAIASSIAVAVVNASVLLAGYGLVALVAATTCVRIVAYFVYRSNAYRIFPELEIRLSLFRRSRLREVTGFSVYSSIIDWANKLNYQLDELVIGAFMGSSAVAVWAPGRADHHRHAAAHEPVERRALPGDRRQRRVAAEARGCSRSCCRARGCRS